MAITTPPTIPLITDPATFSTRAQDWVVWQADQLYPALVEESLLLGLSLSGTSVTSNTVGTGSKSFTTQTGLGFKAGMSLSIARTAAPTNRMFVVVTSYVSGTGALVVTSQAFEGSGTFTDWSIAPAFNGVISTTQIADLAVTNAKLASDSVTTAKILNDNVTNAKLASTAKANKLFDIDASVAGNNLTVTINEFTADFRSTTLTDGTPVSRTVTSPITVVVPNGGTLGSINATLTRLAVLAIDNAGTIEVAVANANGTLILNEQGLISTTIVNTSSDSANVAYSTTARSNVAYRVVGYVEYTQATAGTYATAPSLVQPLGGMAELSGVNSSAEVTATGTSVDITGIPSWTKKISVLFNGVSTSGTSNILVQLGNGTVISSGYTSTATTQSGATTVNSTTGMLVTSANGASDIHSGIMHLMKVGQTGMVSSSLVKASGTLIRSAAGDLSYTGTIDRIRFTTVNGTDAFDGGTFTIIFE